MPRRQIRKQRGARSNISRAIRRIRSRPVANVRPKATIRAKGNSTASTNVLRNLKAAVRRIDNEGQVKSKWWFEALKTVAFTILKVLATAVIGDQVDEHLKNNPLPLDHPLHGKLLAGASVTGSITRLCLGPEDLLVDSDFITIQDPGSTWLSAVYGKARYRQAKVDWIRVVIQPTNASMVREGTIIACLRPVTDMEARQDFAALGEEEFTWEELQRAPGAIAKTASTPTVLTWSPKPNDRAYNWLTIGTQSKDRSPFITGGDIFLYLDFGYQNWTSSENKPANEYGLDKALFDITIEAHVNLRSYEDEIFTRAMPWTTVKPNELTVSAWGRTDHSISLDEVYLHKGMFLYNKSSVMEIC